MTEGAAAVMIQKCDGKAGVLMLEGAAGKERKGKKQTDI